MTKINTVEELRDLYGFAKGRAVSKVIKKLEKHSKQFLSLSPFCLIATVDNSNNADVSPKGDHPGFVGWFDDATLLIPDRPGNNRLDGLANLIENPAIGLIFLIPGVKETLRINGKADISTDSDLLARFEVNGKQPKTVIKVHIEEIFLHCAKSIMRSKLWDIETQIDRSILPTISQMIVDQANEKGDALLESNDDMIKRYEKALY